MTKRLTPDEWNQIDKIFQEVVELNPEERPNAIKRLTNGNQHQQREVNSLLKHDHGNQLPAIAAEKHIRVQSNRRNGERIGDYELLYPVSVNSASEVWCAATIGTQKANRVAIKFLRNESNNPTQFHRFQNEVIRLSNFRHPNIAGMIDCGRDQNDVPYFVMPFVPGIPIIDFADKQRLNVRQRINLLIDVCDAVMYAHRFLIVHRDLKPSNILVTQNGQPYLIDFGISKQISESTDWQLTSTSESPMTPAYASPEQVRGEPVTTSTDLHALGLILYELVCGHHPYSDVAHFVESTESQPIHAINLFDRVCVSLPRRPSDMARETTQQSTISNRDEIPNDAYMLAALRVTSPRKLQNQLRQGVDGVVFKAIAKTPEARYAAVADFRADLANLVAGRPVSVRIHNNRIGNAIRRRPVRAAWMAVIASAFVVSLLAFAIARVPFRHKLQMIARLESKVDKEREIASVQKLIAKNANDDLFLLESNLPAIAIADSETIDFVRLRKNLDLNVRAKLARINAERSSVAMARGFLCESDEDEIEKSLPTIRIDAAAAKLALGLPANGLQILGSLAEQPRKFDSKNRELEKIRLRLILDAKDTSEIQAASKFDYTESFADTDFLLLVAEIRSEIGWQVGAKDLITKLSKRRPITPIQRQKARLLLLDIARKDRHFEDQLKSIPEFDESISGIQELVIHGQAMIIASKYDRDCENWGPAIERLKDVIARFEKRDLASHFVSLQAIFQLATIAELRKNNSELRQWSERYWSLAKAAKELGTSTSIRTATRLMRMAKNDDVITEVLQQIRPYSNVWAGDGYLEREILRIEFPIEIENEDWPNARVTLKRLVDVERRLWGDQSIEYAYPVAALSYVEQQLGLSGFDQHLDEARRCVGKLLDSEPKTIALSFLAVADVEQNPDWPVHERILMYYLHRHSQPRDQLEMVIYTFEQRIDDAPTPARALANACRRYVKETSYDDESLNVQLARLKVGNRE